ncbi:metallophosphoesterase family protein [Inmirania thermothiophila]|uniref:Calcineurin-like phosphoesterase domain-containing protein n=1 Tax=Inmirania thermothiophila TaxID=1750597 RepID=A0A3N1Y7L3_9GAMM|nr:metallophosphoesterase family protein [Inmirania thermothiophila]ROR34765.1 hypothetical protein EDC57_0669 [Inmirania thermothiophila]
MRIAVVSDSHDDAEALAAALAAAAARGAALALHCGDIVRLETVRALGRPPLPLHLVHGNNHADPEGFPAWCDGRDGRPRYHGEVGRIALPAGPVVFTHDPEAARRLAAPGCALAACGHTHVPRIETLRAPDGARILLVNPGTVAGRGGPATWALVDLAAGRAEILPTPGRDAGAAGALP